MGNIKSPLFKKSLKEVEILLWEFVVVKQELSQIEPTLVSGTNYSPNNNENSIKEAKNKFEVKRKVNTMTCTSKKQLCYNPTNIYLAPNTL